MNLILVHIGNEYPSYMNECISQILKAVASIKIHVLVSSVHVDSITSNERVSIGVIEEIPSNEYITAFNVVSRLDSHFRGGFWKYAVMRFFYMYGYAQQHNLTDIFHIEYDNLIYFDFTKKIDSFRKKNVWLVLDSENRCIPSFMYFKHANAIKDILPTFIKAASSNINDMHALAIYYHTNKQTVGTLPIIINYSETIPAHYYEHYDIFECVFDGACVGQYIGGVDPRNMPGDTTGFINETSVIKCNKCNIEWKIIDDKKCLFINDVPIVNLHIHSKDLKRWAF